MSGSFFFENYPFATKKTNRYFRKIFKKLKKSFNFRKKIKKSYKFIYLLKNFTSEWNNKTFLSSFWVRIFLYYCCFSRVEKHNSFRKKFCPSLSFYDLHIKKNIRTPN